MKQCYKIQSPNSQNVNIVQYTKSVDHPTNESQGRNSREKLHESLEDPFGLSSLRSDGSRNSQAGRLDRVSSGQSQLKGGKIRLEST
jgi:hypothetical protein